MRDFRDAKAMARALRTDLAAKGVRLSQAEALELTAKMLGFRDWNTLNAAIDAESKEPPSPEPAAAQTSPARPPVSAPQMQAQSRFSEAMAASLHRAVALAENRSNTTVEHLLLALTEDADAREVLEACDADVAALAADLRAWLAGATIPREPDPPPAPTVAFHHVVQRAVIHVQSAGRQQVTGANLLVALFSESQSNACALLAKQKVTRFDAVNFIAHGVRKDGGKAT